MKKFRELTEAKDTIVFGFGRFNPPTTGHEKVIKKIASVAGSNPWRVFPSHTQNPKKDPLPQAISNIFPGLSKNEHTCSHFRFSSTPLRRFCPFFTKLLKYF